MRALPPLGRLVAQRDRLLSAQAAASEELTRHREQISDLKAHNAELNRELSRLVVADDHLPPLDYLIMLTYGRSGSTLLQGILNATPGVLMRGENRQALYHLFRYHHTIETERAQRERVNVTTRSPWFGIDEYATAAAVAGLRSLVVRTLLRPRPDTHLIGFKEIRWWQDDWRDYLDFLLELFPGVRFVINVRDHEAVARSKWWAEREDPLGMLARYERRLDDMAEALGERAFRVRYEQYTADPEMLRRLFDWLQAPFDRDRIDAVMSVRHSY
jgi:hypothetical protein